VDVSAPYYRDDFQTPDPHIAPYALPSRETAHNIVRERFRREFASVRSVVVVYDNDPTIQPSQATAWIRFSVKSGFADLMGLGRGGRVQVWGMATAQVFVPAGIGTGFVLPICDEIALRFRHVNEKGVSFLSPTVRTVGRDGGWWQMNVLIPFYSSESNP